MTLARRRLPSTTMPVDAALTHPDLLGAALGPATTWSTWLAVLKAAFGLPLSDQQRATFVQVAGPRSPPTRRVRELWAIVGRRGGKSRVAAALAIYIACFVQHRLAAGEKGTILVLAASQEQAKIVFGYALAFLRQSPVLAQEVLESTRNEIRLRSGIVIAIHSNSFRTVRGRTLLACIFDEIAFWRDETTATPDVETYRAVLPALTTTAGLLIAISTPYRRTGLLHTKYRDHFGHDGDDVLVVQGATQAFNPALNAGTIAAQRLSDPTAAASEWDAEFRSDVSQFLDDACIDAAVHHGRPLELPPRSGVLYRGYVDPSGGRGASYTLAIGHRQDGSYVIDAIRGTQAKNFDPSEVTAQYAELCKQYRIQTVHGDSFSGEWVTQAWRKCGLTYKHSELSKNAIFLETLPLWTRGLVSLPEHPRLLKELRLLERRSLRSGKDVVDHGLHGTDDYANATCGVLQVLASYLGSNFGTYQWVDGDATPAPDREPRRYPGLDYERYSKPPALYREETQQS
jgi:Phage Terminase